MFALSSRRVGVGFVAVALACTGVIVASAPSAYAVGPVAGIGSASILEGKAGTRTMQFTVSLSQSSSMQVSMHYATSSGTAKTATDFLAAAGTLKIAAGKTTGVINVNVKGDSAKEANETFKVTLSAPVNATLSSTAKQATGTIVNDDPPAAGTQVGIGSAAIVEGNTGTRTLTLPVSLSAASGAAVAVHYATAPGTALAGSDYATKSGTIVVPAGKTVASVTVSVTSDVSFEANETFSVVLSAPSGAKIAAAAASGVCTIINDDLPPSSANSWGDNANGMLGDPTVATVNLPTPFQIGTAATWKDVTTTYVNGYPTTLAVRTDGTLWAWGYNGYGQLGDGTTTDQTSPEQIGPDTNWATVSVGRYHTVATKTDGTLWAWGYNTNGQVGDNNTSDDPLAPEQIGADTHWATVSAGLLHTVATKTNGTLWAWGDNSNGQLGDNNTGTDQPAPEQIGADTHWATVSAGDYHTVATKTNGTLWAWGYNSNGQLGDNNTGTDQPAPEQIGADTHWATVSAGQSNTFAVKTDGTLWAWGYNGNGELGDNNAGTDEPTPEHIGTDTNWATVNAGVNDTFAVKTGGTLWAWGYNGNGQFGDGTTNSQASPVQVGTDTNWATVSAAAAGTFAVKTTGTLWTWGNNAGGLLGSPTIRTSPGAVATAGPWKSIANGADSFGLGVKADGTLWAWGYNGYSQLGDGTTDDHHAPEKIGTDTHWARVAAGQDDAFAIKTDGSLWAWGYDGSGQLGDGTPSSSQPTPEQIGTVKTWKTVSAAGNHTVALRTDGTLWAWGDNSYGQLGDTTNSPHYAPEKIGTATTWSTVTAGYYDTLATRTDGTLWAWGDNSYGQLGDGSNIGHFAPEKIGTAKNWKMVSASNSYYYSYTQSTLAVRTDGSLWGWGANGYGQLGENADSGHNSPVQIGTNKTWDLVSAGANHTVALRGNHTLWAWGDNTYGELGDGTTTSGFTPKQIGTATTWDYVAAGTNDTLALKN